MHDMNQPMCMEESRREREQCASVRLNGFFLFAIIYTYRVCWLLQRVMVHWVSEWHRAKCQMQIERTKERMRVKAQKTGTGGETERE